MHCSQTFSLFFFRPFEIIVLIICEVIARKDLYVAADPINVIHVFDMSINVIHVFDMCIIGRSAGRIPRALNMERVTCYSELAVATCTMNHRESGNKVENEVLTVDRTFCCQWLAVDKTRSLFGCEADPILW